MGILHESREQMSASTLDMKRAIDSLREELEAVDWYNQRANATGDDSLRAILVHNMNEEKEHAAMLLEWIRRHDEVFDEQLRDYQFTEASIASLES